MDPIKIALWLDDKRPMPFDFGWDCDTRIHALTAMQAINVLQGGKVDLVSLDHDLGDETKTGNGYQVACFIEEAAHNNSIPRLRWAVHSMNPVGALNMKIALALADKYWMDHVV